MGGYWVTQGAQPGALWQPRRVGVGGRWEGGNMRAENHVVTRVWCVAAANTTVRSNGPTIRNKSISKKRMRVFADVFKVGIDLKSSWIWVGPTFNDGIVIRDRRVPIETARKQSLEWCSHKPADPRVVGSHQNLGRGREDSPLELPEALISEFWLPERWD